MLADALLSFLATLLSVLFGLLLLGQFLLRRRPHQLVWAISLGCYAVGVGAAWLAQLGGWTLPLYRAFYLFGGLYVAAYLGMGSVLLALGRPSPFALAKLVGVALILAGFLLTLLDPRSQTAPAAATPAASHAGVGGA